MLNKLKQSDEWKESVYNTFKVFAGDVLPADAKYTIDCIQMNDRAVFTEFTFIIDSDPSKKKARIVANIGFAEWNVDYLWHDIYEL